MKRLQSPKAEKTYPPALQEQEIPASPGKPPSTSKSSFLSRFRSNKSTPQEPAPVPFASAGRVTPEQSESRGSSSDHQKSRDSSPKSGAIGLASSTYRSLSHSFTDLASIASRSKPSSPDIEPVVPPLPSPRSIDIISPPPIVEKPSLLPFRADSIQRQGWLNKRPDSDIKRSKSGVSVPWKLQRAIVHDSRLYLYNPHSILGIKAFTPDPTPAPTDLPSPPFASTHNIKHSHSPSEGVAAQASTGQVSLAQLERRPSTAPTAPHALPTGYLIHVKNSNS
jgi:hypothetical protein